MTESAAKYDEIYCEWAPNEKVAMETAGGAAIAGARSFCGMKHVGLNVAADPLFTLSYTGVNAGMVIVVADDPGMHSSQNSAVPGRQAYYGADEQRGNYARQGYFSSAASVIRRSAMEISFTASGFRK